MIKESLKIITLVSFLSSFGLVAKTYNGIKCIVNPKSSKQVSIVCKSRFPFPVCGDDLFGKYKKTNKVSGTRYVKRGCTSYEELDISFEGCFGIDAIQYYINKYCGR